jgi:hypothetical protein
MPKTIEFRAMMRLEFPDDRFRIQRPVSRLGARPSYRISRMSCFNLLPRVWTAKREI